MLCPKAHGPVTINYTGPIVLDPNASLDTILGFLATHLNVPKRRLQEAMARTKGGGQTEADGAEESAMSKKRS